MASANGVAPKLELTAAQRSAIYQAVHKDKSKVAPSRFATNVGAEVPPMIELYMLPDDILANNPVTKLYKFTRVDDQVVLVDPTNMRVIAVIGPKREGETAVTMTAGGPPWAASIVLRCQRLGRLARQHVRDTGP